MHRAPLTCRLWRGWAGGTTGTERDRKVRVTTRNDPVGCSWAGEWRKHPPGWGCHSLPVTELKKKVLLTKKPTYF